MFPGLTVFVHTCDVQLNVEIDALDHFTNHFSHVADNQKTFEKNPEKILPAYGGYCAFGTSVGKKYIGDPEVWRIVDGKLYVNLDTSIQSEWLKDVPGRIRSADANWPSHRSISPGAPVCKDLSFAGVNWEP